jgi:nucleotide-binding universal stress UspA family protein
VVFSKAYREILKVAEEDGAELIVMGVHGTAALNRRPLGSTPHIVREAGGVLTLRA